MRHHDDPSVWTIPHIIYTIFIAIMMIGILGSGIAAIAGAFGHISLVMAILAGSGIVISGLMVVSLIITFALIRHYKLNAPSVFTMDLNINGETKSDSLQYTSEAERIRNFHTAEDHSEKSRIWHLDHRPKSKVNDAADLLKGLPPARITEINNEYPILML